MKPEELVALINKALEPYAKSIGDLDNVMVGIQRKVEKLANVSDLHRVEATNLIDKEIADIRIEMAQNPDRFRGLPGPQGEQGLVGQRGEKGKNGSDGQPGSQGKQGIPGAQGKQGPAGERGETGYPGPQGEQGAQGKDGIPGTQGKQGEPGPEGKRGLPGDRGETGYPGPQGERGAPGKDGKAGAPGENGKNGLRGEQGPRGEKGMSGEQGDVGPAGATGGRGERGFMHVVRQWEPGEHIVGSQLTHKGSTWQATYTTSKEPGHDVRAWELISDGTQVEKESEYGLTVRSGSGITLEYPNLRGAKGEKGDKGDHGESIRFFEEYEETQMYRKDLDEVKESTCVWRALKNGILHRPGTKRGKGQWKLTSGPGPQGPAGPPGRDADEFTIQNNLVEFAKNFIADEVTNAAEYISLAVLEFDTDV